MIWTKLKQELKMFESLLTGLLSQLGNTLITKVFPNKDDQMKAQTALLQLQQDGYLKELAAQTDLLKAQANITAIEAQSESFFKYGARPFLLWATGFIFILPGLLPYLGWLFNLVGVHMPQLPVIDNEIYNTALFGLLGLAGMRSFDKLRK